MTPPILGLDIGGANLKAAASDRRAASVAFPLWKHPDRLPAVLAELVAPFADCEGIALTMTGELCDCFETKREGVRAIVAAVRNVSRSRPIHVWGTDGRFRNSEEAIADALTVASANWHALATYVGEYDLGRAALLLDIGSTTTDVIPIKNGRPIPEGKTDHERMYTFELVYTGVRRTPVCSILGFNGAAELFATMLDVYLVLGSIPESPTDTDTADGRPATRAFAHARLCRMLGGDQEVTTEEVTRSLAEGMADQQRKRIWLATEAVGRRVCRLAKGSDTNKLDTIVVSGSGEFLARQVAASHVSVKRIISLSEGLGPELSACAPAYAVAVLAAERRP
jgi:probable H4MPT-linked C1 transfer pathway protein